MSSPSPPSRMPPPVPVEEGEPRPRAGSNSSSQTITIALLNSGSDRPVYSRKSSSESLLEEELSLKTPNPPTNTPVFGSRISPSSPSSARFSHSDLPSPIVVPRYGFASLLNPHFESQQNHNVWQPGVSSAHAASSPSQPSQPSRPSSHSSSIAQEVPSFLNLRPLVQPRAAAQSFVAQRAALFESGSNGQTHFMPPPPIVLASAQASRMSTPSTDPLSVASPEEPERSRDHKAFARELTRRLRIVESSQETELPPAIPPRNPARLVGGGQLGASPRVSSSAPASESVEGAKPASRLGSIAGSSSESPSTHAERAKASPAMESKDRKGKGKGVSWSQEKLDGQHSPQLEPASGEPSLRSLISAFPHLDPGHPGIDSNGRVDHYVVRMQKISGLHKRIGERIHKLPLPVVDRIISFCVLRPYLYPFRYPTTSVSNYNQPVFTGVLHISKRITKRALYLLYTRNDFHFRHAADLASFSVAIGLENAKRVRYLTVALTLRPAPWTRFDSELTDSMWEELTAEDVYPAREAKFMETAHELAVVRYIGSFYSPLSALLLCDPRPFALPFTSLPVQEQVLTQMEIACKPPRGQWNVFPNIRGVEIDVQDVRCWRGCHPVWTCELLVPVLKALRARCRLGQVSGGDGWEEAREWFQEIVEGEVDEE